MQSTGSAAWKATSFPGSVTGSSTRLVRATCADALRPIWLTKTVTACRTRQRCSHHAVDAGTRSHRGESCHGSRLHPPKQSTQATHQPAMPWPLVPQFVATHLAQHTPGRTKCPDPGALFHPTATCPRTRRPAACRHHQKKIASGVRSMLEWVRRSMARSTMSPTRCRPRAWLIQPAGTTRTLTPAQRSVDTDVRQCISRKP